MSQLSNYTYDEISIGQTASHKRIVTDEDVKLFAAVSGDVNPVHLDEAFAAKTQFKDRIAHGMLTAGLISAIIGEQLPGHGSIYLKQSLTFLAPVRPGDLVEAEVKVVDIDYGKRRVSLDCRCKVGDTTVLKGDALVLAPSAKFD